jgi:hypothetical protein
MVTTSLAPPPVTDQTHEIKLNPAMSQRQGHFALADTALALLASTVVCTPAAVVPSCKVNRVAPASLELEQIIVAIDPAAHVKLMLLTSSEYLPSGFDIVNVRDPAEAFAATALSDVPMG